MNTSHHLAPCALALTFVFSGCATTAVRQLGDATAANATLVSVQITRLESSRRNLVDFQQQLLTERIAQVSRRQARVEQKLQVWKLVGEEGLVEDFAVYRRLSEAACLAPADENALSAARNKRIAEQVPAASGSPTQLTELGKLLSNLTPKGSLRDALKRHRDYWSATKKLIDEAVEKAKAAESKIPEAVPAASSS